MDGHQPREKSDVSGALDMEMALLRRHQACLNAAEDLLSFGTFTFDPLSKTVALSSMAVCLLGGSLAQTTSWKTVLKRFDPADRRSLLDIFGRPIDTQMTPAQTVQNQPGQNQPEHNQIGLRQSVKLTPNSTKQDPQANPGKSLLVMIDPGQRSRTDPVLGLLCDTAANADTYQQDQWRRLAITDPLTGLVNRKGFRDHLDAAMQDSRANKSRTVLVLLDLDRFKLINDTYGHPAGDALLKAVADTFLERVRACDLVTRLGGDEFALLLKIDDDFATDHHAKQIHTHIQTIVERIISPGHIHLTIEERHIRVGFSVGIAIYPDQAVSARELIRHADLALYQSKKRGRKGTTLFDASLAREHAKDITMLGDVERALSDGEIIPYLQPIHRLADDSVWAFEALARWQHKDLGQLLPATFVRVFQDVKAAPLVDRAIRHQALLWLSEQTSSYHLTLNMNASDICDEQIIDKLLQDCADYDIPPDWVTLDITEDILLSNNTQRQRHILKALSKAGFTIALDDFGKGQSSVRLIRDWPIDIVKIDRSLVRDLPLRPDNQALIQALMTLSEAFGHICIAEGVETPDERRLVQDFGVELAQGFLTSMPRSPANMSKMIKMNFQNLPILKTQAYAVG